MTVSVAVGPSWVLHPGRSVARNGGRRRKSTGSSLAAQALRLSMAWKQARVSALFAPVPPIPLINMLHPDQRSEARIPCRSRRNSTIWESASPGRGFVEVPDSLVDVAAGYLDRLHVQAGFGDEVVTYYQDGDATHGER